MHALFHIETVIIPRDRYRPEGFSSRVDIGWGMITVLIWKKTCINLLITYLNIELKRTKLTSHTDTKLMDMSDRYRLRFNLSSLNVDIFLTTINSWAEVTSWGSWDNRGHSRYPANNLVCIRRINRTTFHMSVTWKFDKDIF
jgi:hypothetical protein